MGRPTLRIALGVVALLICAGGCGHSTARSSGAGGLPGTTPTSTESSLTTASPGTSSPTRTATSPTPAAAAPQAAGSCHVRGSGLYVLPDPSCTPGATDPAVSQADIDRTICTSGWTATIRPPESYTEPLKYQQMAAYGESGSAGGYEEDHLIPLELGGSPTSPRNLWPEPGASPNPKDSVEDAANQAVCAGRMTLAAARQAIAANWIAFGRQLGVTQTPAPQPSSPQSPATPAPGGSTASCRATASYDAGYGDWDVYVHSNRPDQTVMVTASGGETASYHTDSSGYADVYLHAAQNATGQRVTVTVGGATCTTTL